MRTITRPFVASSSKLPTLLLAFALMPSLLYVGHWGASTGHDHTHTGAAADPLTEHQHEAHCHSGPASCAEQPPPSSFTPFVDAVRPDMALGPERVLPAASEPVPQSHIAAPPTPPPNGAL